ncbi:M48 family metallopeptidase [Paraliobacillus sediminis]|uniref:M48 family metallopeptidase n=1 Tax=Paraliobacillus sediminis TaxID=1885916 RepID=UPI000E3EA86D|nr:M48 family metallopeptidase [Paraliobacillus sediminis]
MKKILLAYAIYLVVVFGYFLFLYPLQTLSDTNYAAIAHALFFGKLPLIFILLYGVITYEWIRKWQEAFQWRNRFIETSLVGLLLLFIYQVIQLPFDLFWFYVTHAVGTSNQSLLDWVGELTLDLLFLWIGLTLLLLTFQWLVKKRKKSWPIILWLITIPVAIFVVYIQPVWIDPLYEDFTPLAEGELRHAIEALTADAGLQDATLLQVNMSEKVTTFNAYVTGIFGNARIVLWDTTIEGMNQSEILFILAHEIGHYLMNHVYYGVIGYLLFALVLILLIAFFYRRIMDKKFPQMQLSDIRAIPVLLFITMLVLTISQPVSLFVSRQMEVQADTYAIEHTEELEPAIEGFIRMSIQSKSDINPVFWVKWMRYSHPPMQERIDMIERVIKERKTK